MMTTASSPRSERDAPFTSSSTELLKRRHAMGVVWFIVHPLRANRTMSSPLPLVATVSR